MALARKKQFYVYAERKTWEEALRACHTKDMSLAIITSHEEQQDLLDSLRQIDWDNPAWLGGQLQHQDDWEWIDGRKVVPCKCSCVIM